MGKSKKKNSPLIVKVRSLFHQQDAPRIIAICLCLLFILSAAIVSVNRFWQYEVFYYDFGIFDIALRNAARLRPPTIEHFVVGGKWIFADHFNPSIFLLTPLYWITKRSEILLFAQAVCVGLSGYVLFLLGKKMLKNTLAPFAVLVSYFLFAGLQNAVITDFHEVTVATLPFMLCYYFFITKRHVLYFLSLVILLGFKESNFLLGVSIGISLFFLDRKQWKIAIVTCVISLLWGMLAIKVIIPYFSNSNYTYEIIRSKNPLDIAYSLVNHPEKIRTLFFSFMSFGFVPLLAPQFWLLLLQDFLARFYPPFLTLSWSLGMHYSALTASIMGISSIFGLLLLEKKIKNQLIISAIAIVLIINSLVLFRFILRGPLALAYNPAFYAHTKDFSFLDELITTVPRGGTIMTHNNLAVRFTDQDVMLLRSKCKECAQEYHQIVWPDYIVIDGRSGQNPNNFYGVSDITQLLTVLKKDPAYKIHYNKADQYIFKKVKKN